MDWIYPVASFFIGFVSFFICFSMGRRYERRRMLKQPVFRKSSPPPQTMEFAPVVTQEAEDNDHASVQQVKMQRRRDSF